MNPSISLGPVQEYSLDAWQRSILVLDVLHKRGNRYFEQTASEVPHVLDFETELVRDGRTLARLVNYVLVRIVPPQGVKTDPTKPPLIVVDPRAQVGLQRRQIERDLAREAAEARSVSELEKTIDVGGPLEAVIRALVYVRSPDGQIDERGFTMLKAIRAAQPSGKRLTMAQLKAALKEQFLLVRLDEERALQAIPKLLPKDVEERRTALETLHRMVSARGALPDDGSRRLSRVEALFGVRVEGPAKREAVNA